MIFQLQLLALVLQVVLEISLRKWEFLHDSRNLKDFTKNHTFSLNLMRDELELLHLTNYNLSIHNLVPKKSSYDELLSTGILDFVLLVEAFS